MMNAPKIFKAPDAAGKVVGSYQEGCSYYAGHTAGYSCSSFNGTCIDTTFTSNNHEGAAGIVAGIIGVIIGLFS